MDLRYLRFFIAIAEEANFTRAAERLHTVQPSLSNQIKRLEEIVGTPLLIRDKHQTHLTPAGNVFLKHCRKLLENYELALEAARAAARAEEGNLTIGYIPGTELIIFPRILPALHNQFPDMNFRLITGYYPQLFEALQSDVLDFVFGHRIKDPTIVSKVVARIRLVVAVPANHQLAAFDRIPPAELAKYPFIAPAATRFPVIWKIFDSIAGRAGVVFRQIAEVDNALATLNAVQSGLGAAIIPEYIAQIIPSNVLIKQLDIESEPYAEYCISYRRDSTLPRSILQLLLQCLNIGGGASD